MGFDNSQPGIGEMLCSFSIVVDDYRYRVPVEYMKLT